MWAAGDSVAVIDDAPKAGANEEELPQHLRAAVEKAVDEADVLANARWSTVYGAWLLGDPQPMATWLKDPATVIPDDARDFLAAMVRGDAKRPRGRPQRWPPQLQREIAAEVYKAREAHLRQARPHERAIEEVAKGRHMSVDTVRGIVEKVASAGVTYEAWIRWGHPQFDQTT